VAAPLKDQSPVVLAICVSSPKSHGGTSGGKWGQISPKYLQKHAEAEIEKLRARGGGRSTENCPHASPGFWGQILPWAA
jgi:hypothetical protein